MIAEPTTAHGPRALLMPWLQGLQLLVLLQFVLFGLLVAGQAVPDRPVVENLLSAVENGTYGPNSALDRMGGVADTFTECVVVGTGIGASPDESAFSRAVRMPRIGNCGGGAEDLRTVAAGEVIEGGNYYKYWAGYTVITRPILALMGLEGLRIVSGALMLLTAVGAALGAALFCYVDLLTTPAVPWAMSAFVLGAVAWHRTRVLRDALLGVLVGGAVWPVVFGFTWVSRWAIAALFLGFSDTLETVRQNVGFRTAGDHAAVSEAFGAATKANGSYWWYVLPTSGLVLTGCLLAVAAGLALALRRGGPARWAVAVVLALPAFAVPLWYEALGNHSQIHTLFTYRGVPAAFAVGTAACLSAAARGRPGSGARQTTAVDPGAAEPAATEPEAPEPDGQEDTLPGRTVTS